LLSGLASFVGHAIYALIFSSGMARDMYQKIHRLINGLVGIGFYLYGAQLIYGLLN
jgi:threonine/homoserine/homoserine lactone efflux protein